MWLPAEYKYTGLGLYSFVTAAVLHEFRNMCVTLKLFSFKRLEVLYSC